MTCCLSTPIRMASGDLAARDLEGGANLQEVSGDVSLNTALRAGRSYTVNARGDIAARVEIGSGARIELEGSEVHCRLPLQSAERKRGRIAGTLGDGSAQLMLRASGELSLTERGEGAVGLGRVVVVRAVGHAVRAAYMYCAMADIAALWQLFELHEKECRRLLHDAQPADRMGPPSHVGEHFGDRVFPLTVPINAGPGFNQVLDIPRNEIITYATDKSGKFTEAPATGALLERAKQLHNQLVEYIAESDDALMEKFFAQGGLSEEEMRAGLHRRACLPRGRHNVRSTNPVRRRARPLPGLSHRPGRSIRWPGQRQVLSLPRSRHRFPHLRPHRDPGRFPRA